MGKASRKAAKSRRETRDRQYRDVFYELKSDIDEAIYENGCKGGGSTTSPVWKSRLGSTFRFSEKNGDCDSGSFSEEYKYRASYVTGTQTSGSMEINCRSGAIDIYSDTGITLRGQYYISGPKITWFNVPISRRGRTKDISMWPSN